MNRTREYAVFATHFGVWGQALISRVLGVTINVVKEASSARHEPYRSLSTEFRMYPFSYMRERVPPELLNVLDAGEPIPNDLGPPKDYTQEEVLEEWRTRFNQTRESSAPFAKFSPAIRNGILYETRRITEGAPSWSVPHLITAFGLTKSLVYKMRNGSGLQYRSFRHEFDGIADLYEHEAAFTELYSRYYNALVFTILADAPVEETREDLVYRKLGTVPGRELKECW